MKLTYGETELTSYIVDMDEFNHFIMSEDGTNGSYQHNFNDLGKNLSKIDLSFAFNSEKNELLITHNLKHLIYVCFDDPKKLGVHAIDKVSGDSQ